MTQSIDDTLDILQESFIKAFIHYKEERSDIDNLKWLITVTKNATYTYMKKNKKHEPLENYFDTIGSSEIDLFSIYIANLKDLGTSMPVELIDHLLMNIIEGESLLSISKKTNISYERLRYWKKTLIKQIVLYLEE